MYLVVSDGLLYFAGVVQIALLIGIMTALLAERLRDALMIGVVGLLILQRLSPPMLPLQDALRPSDWLLSAGVAAMAVCGVWYARVCARHRETQLARVLAALIVVWLIVNLWVPLVVAGTHPLVGYGPLTAQSLRAIPQAGQYITDDALYRRFFFLLHQGQGHYEAFSTAWRGLSNVEALPASVTAYRLPTFYWIWRALPDDAFLIVVVFLAFASIGVIAAASITGQLIGARYAPLAAAALACYGMCVAISVYVTYIDLPAACIALVGVALLVRATLQESRRWLWSALAVLTLAALTREILAYLLVFGALSALRGSPAERWRRAAPWCATLAVFAAGYALHAYQVVTQIAQRTVHLSYLGGSPAFALKALTLFSAVFSFGKPLLFTLFVGGVVGAWHSRGRTGLAFSQWSIMVLVVPVVAMTALGNPGIDAQGAQVNYWGLLFVPLALALWPVALAQSRPTSESSLAALNVA
jgi:hypothetical protein